MNKPAWRGVLYESQEGRAGILFSVERGGEQSGAQVLVRLAAEEAVSSRPCLHCSKGVGGLNAGGLVVVIGGFARVIISRAAGSGIWQFGQTWPLVPWGAAALA